MIWIEIEGNNFIDLSHSFSGPQCKLLGPPVILHYFFMNLFETINWLIKFECIWLS